MLFILLLTLHCQKEECIGEEKFPEDQEICYGRDFAPISNVDVSLDIDNYNIVAADVDVDASNYG